MAMAYIAVNKPPPLEVSQEKKSKFACSNFETLLDQAFMNKALFWSEQTFDGLLNSGQGLPLIISLKLFVKYF